MPGPRWAAGVYKNMPRGIIALVFRCKTAGGALSVSDEVTGFRWVDEEEVADLADEAYAIRVLDALSHDAPPAIRAHDGVRLLAPGHAK